MNDGIRGFNTANIYRWEYKVLGQSSPSATTATTAYIVPATKQALISTLSVCNVGVSTTVRVSIRVASVALANKHYILYDVTLNQYESIFLDMNIYISAGDIVEVYAGTATVAFGLYGAEITV